MQKYDNVKEIDVIDSFMEQCNENVQVIKEMKPPWNNVTPRTDVNKKTSTRNEYELLYRVI